MKKVLSKILVAEAIACVALCIFGRAFSSLFAAVMAFPFEQVGMGLRALSLLSTVGNVCAILLYSAVCLLPVAYFALRAHREKARGEDALLLLLSGVLFAVLYLMINPAYIGQHFAFAVDTNALLPGLGSTGAMQSFGAAEVVPLAKAMLGMVVYSIIAGYVVLRALRAFSQGETGTVFKHLRLLLGAVCIVLVFGIFGIGLMELISSIKSVAAANEGQQLGLTYVFLSLQYAVNLLPLALQIPIIFSGLSLLFALELDPYSEEISALARKTGKVCRQSIAAIMLSQIAVNVLLLILGSQVHSSHYSLSIPLASVAFVLAAMLLAGYFEQTHKLKHDNDLFV